MGFLVARVLGVTSPKINTRIVIKSVAKMLPVLSPKLLTKRIVAKEAIRILTKLLATKIPPIVFSISSFALFILLFFLESSSWCIFSLGTDVMAVSDPESNAENTKQIIISM